MRSSTIAVAASMGALASVLAASKLVIPFPPLPYLKFDLAEIPVFVAFMAFGPSIAGFTLLLYWIILMIVTAGEWLWPLGPFMKFLAVLSTFAGMYVGYRLYVPPKGGIARLTLLMAAIGSAVRISVMGIANYLLLVVLVPGSLDFAASFLSKFLGISTASGMEMLALIMLFTAIFNAIHAAMSLVPSAVLVERVGKLGQLSKYQGPWISLASRRPDRA